MTTWYHVSRNWDFDQQIIHPAVMRVDDENDPRDNVPFIAVCPTLAQCLVALGELSDCMGFPMRAYVARGKPTPASWVFDYSITMERRFFEETLFSYVGDIDQDQILQARGIDLGIQVGLDLDEIIKITSSNLKALTGKDLLIRP